MKKKWYQKNWVIILLLLIFSPIGIALLWVNKMFSPKTRKILSGVFAVYFVIVLIYGALTNDNTTQVVNNVAPTPITTVEPTTEPTIEPTEEPTPEPTEDSDKNIKKEIYNYFNTLLEAEENPANWLKTGAEDYEFGTEEYNEASAKWQQQVDDYEKEATKKTAKKYGITEDEVLEIFWGDVSGFSDSDEGNKEKYSIKYGEFLDSTVNGTTLVIKAKIEPVLTNKQTINQNYFNIEDIIKNQGADEFDEIQYWAVADMTSGDEAKVISFTLNKDLINAIKKGSIVPIQYQDYLEDLYILPSLLER